MSGRSLVVALGALGAIIMTSASPSHAGPVVFPGGSTVEGRTLGEWSGEWWRKVFSIPVYADDGKTIINPMFDQATQPADVVVNATYSRPSDDGKVTFLFGAFFGGTVERTVTIPANQPIFLPIVNCEFSNPDTPTGPNFETLPGDYTIEALADLAKQGTDSVTGLSASIDGQDIPDLASHRESAPNFTLEESGQFSIHNAFFGNPVTSTPAAADGFYLMIDGLLPGEHTLHFAGSSPDHELPLLDAYSVDMTYHITATGATAIPLPVGAWAGLAMLPLALLAIRRVSAA